MILRYLPKDQYILHHPVVSLIPNEVKISPKGLDFHHYPLLHLNAEM